MPNDHLPNNDLYGAPQIVVTMAGRGSRFRAAGYQVPKYAIEVHGRTLFEWSLLSLRDFTSQGAPVTFVALREHAVLPFVERQCAKLGIARANTAEIEDVTDGQASSVLAAAPHLNADRALLVYNIDTFVHPQSLRAGDVRGDGWIPCFPGAGEGWSFARADGQSRVLEVREKKRISPHASVGLYGFSSFKLYSEAYHAYYADGQKLERGEKYIAPLYNQLLAWKRPVYLSELPLAAVHPLGTPDEVRAFAREAAPVL